MTEETLEKYEKKLLDGDLSDIPTEKLEKLYEILDKETKHESWKVYCDYNIRDVDLVLQLDEKLSFIALIQMQAYFTRVAMEKVASPIRKFDSYLLSVLKDTNKVIPTAVNHEKEQLPGGYVAEPRKGYYRYSCSWDFKALYPHIMFALNLSPETYVMTIMDEIGNNYINLDLTKIDDTEMYMMSNGLELDRHIISGKKLRKFIKTNKLLLAPNGVLFKSKEGLIPKLVHGVFNKRKEYKNIMQEFEKKYEHSKSKDDKDLAKKYKLYQNGVKIFANSIYGILAQQTFRFYDINFAAAITLTGQKLNTFVSGEIDDLFRELFGPKVVATIYGDTDSVYLDYSAFVDQNNVQMDELIPKINEFNKDIVEPFIDKILNRFSGEMINNPKNWFDLERESIATSSIFVKKKKYALNVLDEEGNTYSEPQMKVKGMEIVRSSTPSFCREGIKDVVKLMLDTMDRKQVVDTIRSTRKAFKKQELPNVSFPRGINNLKKYTDFPWPEVGKQCPIQVRAANNYNYLIKKLGLELKYGLIHEGEKAKYVHIYLDNPVLRDQNVVGFKEVLPEEFNLDKYIDTSTQFEKSFMSPIQTLSECVGWGKISVSTVDLSSIF